MFLFYIKNTEFTKLVQPEAVCQFCLELI